MNYTETVTRRVVKDTEKPLSEFVDYMPIAKVIRQLDQTNKILAKRITALERQNKQLSNRVIQLENHTMPVDNDVYNINRRIEILAQKISIFQSNNKNSHLRRLLFWK